MVKRSRNASVDLGQQAVDGLSPSAATIAPDVPGFGQLADGSPAPPQPTSPTSATSNDPSALKRRRIDRSSSAEVARSPTASPTKAAPEALAAVEEEPDATAADVDLALLTALAQEHAAEIDGALDQVDAEAADGADAEDQVDDRRLEADDAARLLKIFEAMSAGNPHLEGVLDQPPHAETDPALQSTLRQLLSPLEGLAVRSEVEAALEAISGGEDPSDSFYAQRVAPRDTAEMKRVRELAEFGRDAVRVLEGLGQGRKGKGFGKPKRKIALYQKIASHPGNPTQLFGPRYFTEPIDVDSDEEFEETGHANVIEIHPSPELPSELQPTLGQSSRPRSRKLKPVSAVKDTSRSVTLLSREDPFSSFLPAYDSTTATLSLSETITRMRKAEAMEVAHDESLAEPLPSWAPLEKATSENGATRSVEAMLRRNWEHLARLKEAQVARVRKGLAMAAEDESATAQELAETLAQLIALRPSPSLVPSPAEVRSLHSKVGLDNPPPSYRGTLDGARSHALSDNLTLKVVYAQPPVPAPLPQQQKAPSPVPRQGSYGPAPTSGGQVYRPPPPQRVPSYPQQQQYQPSPRQGYPPQGQGHSPMYATGSPYPQQPPPQWQHAPPPQHHRPPSQPAPYAHHQQTYPQQQQQPSAPIPMMGWNTGASTAPPLPPSVQAASSYPEGMW